MQINLEDGTKAEVKIPSGLSAGKWPDLYNVLHNDEPLELLGAVHQLYLHVACPSIIDTKHNVLAH